jgi:BirA family transcriptional regulator, biotin operon repressor / biotin---[acetyl-CoA-carboxylase] ligase
MSRRLGEPLIRLEHVTSTMDELAALAERGAAEGTAVLADAQTVGRGRAGRVWESAPGTAILLSVLLRPTVPSYRLTVLPLIVGVAVAEAVEAETGLVPRLKWPNDVLIGERKVAGILTTARSDGPVQRVIVGIGLNVNASPDRIPAGATSLSIERGTEHDRERLVEAIFERLDAAYRDFERTGGAFEPTVWERRAAFLGDAVTIEDGGRTLTGVLRGVERDGALILDLGAGGRQLVVAGELSRGPRPLVADRR